MTDALKMAIEALRSLIPEVPRLGERDDYADDFLLSIKVTSGEMRSARKTLATLEQAGEPVADDPEFREYVRKAGQRLAPHSADPLGSPTRDALVWINAALHPSARERVPLNAPIAPNAEAPLPTLQRLGQEFGAGEGREQIARIISLAKGQPEKGQASVGAWWWDARHDRALPEHFEGECRDEDRKHADEMIPLLRSVFVGGALAAVEDVGEPVTRPIWNKACVGREGYCSSDLQDAALAAIGDGLKRGFNDGWLAAHKRLNFGYRAEDIQSDWDTYALAHPPQSRGQAFDGEGEGNIVDRARAIIVHTIRECRESSEYLTAMADKIEKAEPAMVDSWLVLDAVIAALKSDKAGGLWYRRWIAAHKEISTLSEAREAGDSLAAADRV